MGGSSSTPATPAAPTKKCNDDSCSLEKKVVEEKPKCKACCACPETKKIRDAW